MARAAAKRKGGPRKPRERGLYIDGKFYAFPDTYTLDELAGVLDIWDVDGMHQIPEHKDNLFHPLHIKCLVWVSLRRQAERKAEKTGSAAAYPSIDEVGAMKLDRIEPHFPGLLEANEENGNGASAGPPAKGPAAAEKTPASGRSTSKRAASKSSTA